MDESVELRTAFIEQLGDNIICIRYKEGFVIEDMDAKEIDDMQHVMSGGKDMLLMVDIFGVKNQVSKSAKEFFTKKGKMLPFTKGVAIIQKDVQTNLSTGFFSNWFKPLYPTKIFETRKEAIKWLKGL